MVVIMLLFIEQSHADYTTINIVLNVAGSTLSCNNKKKKPPKVRKVTFQMNSVIAYLIYSTYLFRRYGVLPR